MAKNEIVPINFLKIKDVISILKFPKRVLTTSFHDFQKFITFTNFRATLFPLISIAYKEIFSLLCFFWVWKENYPMWFFILFSILAGIFSYLWGALGDVVDQKSKHEQKYKLILLADILISSLFILEILNMPKWLIIILLSFIDTQSNARSALASRELLDKNGTFHEKSLFLNKLSWAVIFLCWTFFTIISDYQLFFIALGFLLCLGTFILYPKKILKINDDRIHTHRVVKSRKQVKSLHLMLLAFMCFESIFFLLWSFAEGKHVPINFFPLVGGSCLIGNILSFFIGKDKEIRIIKHMYLAIFVLTFSSFLVLIYFSNIETLLTLYAIMAALSGIYLPYIYDEAMRIYGKHRRGEASGIVEIYGAVADTWSTVAIKFIASYLIVNIISCILATIGFGLTILEEKFMGKDS